VWSRSRMYDDCSSTPIESAVVDDGTSILYAPINVGLVWVMDSINPEAYPLEVQFSYTLVHCGFLVGADGLVYYGTAWPSNSSPQLLSHGVCKFLPNMTATEWCVEVDTTHQNSDQIFTCQLSFDEVHLRVVVASFTPFGLHRVTSLDLQGTIMWTTPLPDEYPNPVRYQRLALDEMGNYYCGHGCCFLTVLRWDTGNETTIKIADDGARLNAIGAERLYFSVAGGILMMASGQESTGGNDNVRETPWYDTAVGVGGLVAGSVSLVLLAGLGWWFLRGRSHKGYLPLREH